MSIDPEYDSVVTVETQPDGQEPATPEPEAHAPVAVLEAPAVVPTPQTVAVPEAFPVAEAEAYVAPVAAPRVRTRPRWAVPAAIAAVGLIASGALGYLFYSTNSKLDATRHQLAVTQLNLDGTNQKLTAAQADAKDKKVTADYVSMYVANTGKVETDYQEVVACDSFSSCRTAAQAALNDMQAFQSARQSATVPSALSAADSELGDSLSAGIAAVQELINGMDTGNRPKIMEGFNRFDDAMLSMAKAEADLGADLR